MPAPKFQKFLVRLRELFELDKADLDFGLYRLLRAWRDEIDRFLGDELLPQVQGELGVVAEEKIKPTAPRFKVRTIEPEFHRLMFEGIED
jgi:hypothetical protein